MVWPIRGGTIRILAAAAVILLVWACTSSGEVPSSDSKAVSFRTTDGVSLEGWLFGPERGSAGVVLAHMFPTDQSSWFSFADRLADRGYRVLTFNFRGYCPGGDGGCSGGEKTIRAFWRDVEAAVVVLRDEGVTRVALVGASVGGTASLIAASQEGQEIDAVVTLSAPTAFEGLEANAEVLAEVTAAKLFIAGHEDTVAVQAVDTLYAESLQPKRPVILTTGDHGTDILSGNQAGPASTEIIRWLDRYIPVNP